ncbi:MAG: bifunctional (p)ppGpp synthetase/guanosine-3',5'-bis(diphosphate) 3'-pyrophosphohydrolase, partial [Chloroflexi bacterium]|nr:bifunctional (p)ppGpp synthetase/guanosine-3',5'-bis(diphosphate) 3'-pyrophosphohydrolase [Chloroflexota bacterium]
MKFEDLLASLPAGISPVERDLVERAYRYAEKAHLGLKRRSGEPYISHCLAVAGILTELVVPPAVVAAALLHDTVEDTDVTLEDIRLEFGDEVARLVDGVTKLTQLPRVSRDDGRLPDSPVDETSRRAALAKETIRKTVLAMGDDVRVVLIKLADRLHNMRTLSHMPPDQQKRIARETLDIFAPLANRLGIRPMKWELEDLSFRYLNPARFREISEHLDERRVDRESTMQVIVQRLRHELAQRGIEAEVTGRPKHIYSIYKKMERKGVAFENVFDVRGMRVLVRDIPTCYVTLGVIHSLWRPLPDEFDDYIAAPKDNFYQSLHTAVVYEDGKPLEVQIRTPDMHENAELGIAAHWRYKEGGRRDEHYERRILWLRRIMEWREDVQDANEFVEALRTDVFRDRVYVFTPHGDIIELPAGATPIDFAYHVHTSIGNRCRGARVNGKLVALNYQLRTADQVEILTAGRGGPSRDWLNTDLGMVRTRRASSKIRQWFKKQDREQNIQQGREVLEHELKRLGIRDANLDKLAREFNFARTDDFLAAIGCGDLQTGKVVTRILAREQLIPEDDQTTAERPPQRAVSTDEVFVQGTGGLLSVLAQCCKPVPGDDVVGYVTRGKGVSVHRRDCPNVLRSRDKERLIQVSWGQAYKTYPVSVRVTAYDRGGLMR